MKLTRALACLAAAAAVFASACGGLSTGTTMLRITAYVEDPLITSVHISVPDLIDYGVIPVQQTGGDPRYAATGSPVPSSITITVKVDALDSAGRVLGDAYVVQVMTGRTGSTTYVYIQLPYLNSGGTPTQIGGVTDYPPALDPPLASRRPATGDSVALSYSATDLDPGDPLTYFTMLVSGHATLDGGQPTMAVLGNQVEVVPLDGDPVELLAGVVDSKQRADFWHVRLEPDSGGFEVHDHLTGYAFSIVRPPLVDLIVLDALDDAGQPVVETIADVDPAHALTPDAVRVWKNSTVDSANFYAEDDSTALVRAAILDASAAPLAIDRQMVRKSSSGQLTYAPSTLESGTLPPPAIDSIMTDAATTATLTGHGLAAASYVLLAPDFGGASTNCDFQVSGDTTLTVQLPAGTPPGTYRLDVVTYGDRSTASDAFQVTP